MARLLRLPRVAYGSGNSIPLFQMPSIYPHPLECLRPLR